MIADKKNKGVFFMAYPLLNKLYYQDQSRYAQVYQDRFQSEDTVKLDFSIGDRQAFFVQTGDLWRRGFQILRLNGQVTALSSALPPIARRQYSRKCLIDEIMLTNRIEGVHSSRKEIDDALDTLERQSAKRGKRQRFVSVVNQYLKLSSGKRIPLGSCRDVRDLYDELCLEEVVREDPHNAPDGELFRKDQTAVHNAAGKELHAGLYPESRLMDGMERALNFLNDPTVEELWRVCLFHYLLEYIHPFYDGNGRLGRFILSDRLSTLLDPLLAYRISGTIQENISAYYKAFQTCNDPHALGDLTPFLFMLLDMISAALKDLRDSLEQKQTRWTRYENLVAQFPEGKDPAVHAVYSVLIQAALFSEKGISTAELEHGFQCSYHIVKKLLGQVRPDLLQSGQKGRAKYYQIDLNALDNMLLAQALKGQAEETT